MQSLKQLAEELCHHPVFINANHCKQDAGRLTDFYTSAAETFFKTYLHETTDSVAPNYQDYWNFFRGVIRRSINNGRMPHAICPVAYVRLKAKLNNKTIIVEDFTIRPCAIGHGFLEEILRQASQTKNPWQGNYEPYKFTVKAREAKHILIDDALKSAGLIEGTHFNKNKYPEEFAWITGSYTYIYEISENGACKLSKQKPFDPPDAKILNSFEGPEAENKNRLIKAMVEDHKEHRINTFRKRMGFSDTDKTTPSSFDIPKEDIQRLIRIEPGH